MLITRNLTLIRSKCNYSKQSQLDTIATSLLGLAEFRQVVVTENSVPSENTEVPIIREIMVATTMSSLFVALFALVASSFRTRAALEAAILALRHQLAVFQNNALPRLRLHRCDRLLWIVLCRFWSDWRRCLHMVQPDTVLRWHRRAFAWHWSRKSRRLPGRPEIAADIRDLIRRMRQANPLWGCTADSRRTTQVGTCGGAIHGGQIFAAAPQTAFSDLANLSDEPSGADQGHRFFHRADGDLPGPVRLRGAIA